MMRPSSRYHHLLWLIPLLLLTAWLGARSLNTDLIWFDEFWSINNSGGAFYGPLSPAGIWNRVVADDPGGVGVLYYVLLSGWGSLVGWTPFVLRAFSLLVGLLAMAWTYRLGRDLFSARVGLYAALVLGVSAFYIDYLHEMRSYTLYVLLTLSTVWAYWKLITTKAAPPLRLYVLLGAGFVGLAYSHYVALAVPVAIGCYHLLFVPKNRRWWWIVLVMALSALTFLPWLGVTLRIMRWGLGDAKRQSASMSTMQTVETLLYTFGNGSVALLALVAGYTLLDRRRETVFVWLLVLVTLIAALAVNVLIPFILHIRYLIMLWPLLALVVGLGIVRLGRTGLNPAFILAIWIGAGLWQTFNPAFIHDLFGSVYRAPQAGVYAALDVLKARAQADDLVIFHIAEPGFEEYQYTVLNYLMYGVPGRYEQFERINRLFVPDAADYLPSVEIAIDHAPYVWTLVVPEVPFNQHTVVVNSVLDTEYAPCETVLDRPDVRMRLYARRPEDAAKRFFSTDTAGGDEIGLFPLNLERESNTMLDVVLGWALDESVPPNTYSVGLYLENDDGQVVAQNDYGLPVETFGCSVGHLTLDNLPPGEYTLLAAVYDQQTGEQLPAAQVDTGFEGERLSLERIRIP